jgi:hypothetical protein
MQHQGEKAALFEIASLQAGYFTASQAIAAGYSQKNHHYYIKNGDWIREWRGIYRLARYPVTEDAQYVFWSLWSRDRRGTMQGIYSHETALSLFEISDVNPVKLHMTIPAGFRKSVSTPEILILHKDTLQPDDCEQRAGYSVVKPVPAILTLIKEGTISDDLLIQALHDGIKKGYFVKDHLLKLMAPDGIKSKLHALLKRVR